MTSPSPIHAEAAGGRRNDKKPLQCPNCGHNFDYDDMRFSEEQKMIDVLVAHGFPLRAIGKTLGNMHPQAVKYRLKLLKEGKYI